VWDESVFSLLDGYKVATWLDYSGQSFNKPECHNLRSQALPGAEHAVFGALGLPKSEYVEFEGQVEMRCENLVIDLDPRALLPRVGNLLCNNIVGMFGGELSLKAAMARELHRHLL
jgi:hypothetical protein